MRFLKSLVKWELINKIRHIDVYSHSSKILVYGEFLSAISKTDGDKEIA